MEEDGLMTRYDDDYTFIIIIIYGKKYGILYH